MHTNILNIHRPCKLHITFGYFNRSIFCKRRLGYSAVIQVLGSTFGNVYSVFGNCVSKGYFNTVCDIQPLYSLQSAICNHQQSCNTCRTTGILDWEPQDCSLKLGKCAHLANKLFKERSQGMHVMGAFYISLFMLQSCINVLNQPSTCVLLLCQPLAI